MTDTRTFQHNNNNNTHFTESHDRLRNRLPGIEAARMWRSLSAEHEVSRLDLDALVAATEGENDGDAAQLLLSLLDFIDERAREERRSIRQRQREREEDPDEGNNYGSSDDDDDGEPDIYYLEDNTLVRTLTNIVWLSNDSFLSNNQDLRELMDDDDDDDDDDELEQVHPLFTCCLKYLDTSASTEEDFVFGFYRIRPNSAPNSPILAEVDALFRVLATHKTTSEIILERFYSTAPDDVFPASLAALKAFVGQAASPRQLQLDIPLSVDQWRVIILNDTNKNIKLVFYSWNVGGAALIEAMQRNNQHIPKLELRGLREMPRGIFEEFAAALGENTTLSELALEGVHPLRPEHSRLLFKTLSRNRGLEMIGFTRWFGFSIEEWESFWGAVAVHPTLKAIKLEWDEVEGFQSDRRDQVMIRALQSNTILWNIDFSSQSIFHNPQLVAKEIRPILELNRFRPVVQAIKEEKNLVRRGHLFATTLQSPQICHNRQDPSWYYYLLKENHDLLVQYSRPQDVLLQQWNQTMRRLVTLEERMLVCEIELPTRLPEVLGGAVKRKRNPSS